MPNASNGGQKGVNAGLVKAIEQPARGRAVPVCGTALYVANAAARQDKHAVLQIGKAIASAPNAAANKPALLQDNDQRLLHVQRRDDHHAVKYRGET
ncbi:hypothetical protein GCM10009096_14410 [Parasphingorhabdus litoris]|uniref:Uncharacterized protein n=1 Tax=Parasphingorhabdus litoris TaxID=394733 RepID=A0ABP3K979_9SPHN